MGLGMEQLEQLQLGLEPELLLQQQP